MTFDRHAKRVFFIVCAVLVFSRLGFEGAVKALNYHLRKESVALRAPLGNVSKSLYDPVKHETWRAVGDDQTLDAETVENLGTDKYLDRRYAVNGDVHNRCVDLSIAYYTGMIDAIPHIPDRCLVAAGLDKVSLPHNYPLAIDTSNWPTDPVHVNQRTGKPYPLIKVVDPYTNTPVEVRMPLGDFEVRMTEFAFPNRNDVRIFSGYLFVSNGRTTAVPEKIRLLAFDLREQYAYYAKIQFTIMTSAQGRPEDYVDAVSDLMRPLLPELMRCLPDWSEVEARDAAAVQERTSK